MNTTPNDSEKPVGRSSFHSAGLTLVEMLVVLAIIALITAVGIGVWVTLPDVARTRGTEALIGKIDAKLAQRLADFDRHRSTIQALSSCDLPLANNDPSRGHVIAVIRSMRQEFPEFFYIDTDPGRGTDMIDNDADGQTDEVPPPPAPLAPGQPPAESDEIIVGQWLAVDIDGDTAPNQAFTDLPSAAVAHLKFIERAFADRNYKERDSSGNIINVRALRTLHRIPTARAECLYMIVTAGGTDTDWLAPGETADTDDDGLPEFVDKWGNPIQFFLWPTHYTSPLQAPTKETNPNDPHQLLTEDAASGWWRSNPPPPPAGKRVMFETLFHSLTSPIANSPQGFRTHPLIVSAGPDKGFGLQVASSTMATPIDGFSTNPNDWGSDGVMATLDDTLPLHPRASRITSPGVEGYGMDADNIDNHTLRAR